MASIPDELVTFREALERAAASLLGNGQHRRQGWVCDTGCWEDMLAVAEGLRGVEGRLLLAHYESAALVRAFYQLAAYQLAVLVRRPMSADSPDATATELLKDVHARVCSLAEQLRCVSAPRVCVMCSSDALPDDMVCAECRGSVNFRMAPWSAPDGS
jgi:hypothetical protein